MKGVQSPTSNSSFPFWLWRNLDPEEGDFKLWVVNYRERSSRLLEPFNSELPTACGIWVISCKAVLSSCPPPPSRKSSRLLRCEGWREDNISSHHSEGSRRTLLKPGKLQLHWKLHQSRKQGDMNDHKLMDQINQLLNREKIFFICRILMNKRHFLSLYLSAFQKFNK